MLSLMLKEGEYLTIGEDIVVQVFPDSKSRTRLSISAPKDVTILRGDLREKGGVERPECVKDTPRQRQSGTSLSWNRNKTQALKSMRRLLYKMDSRNPDVKTLRRQLDFLFPPVESSQGAEPITKVSNG